MGTIEYRKLFRANVSLQIEYKKPQNSGQEGLFLSSDLSSSGANVIGKDLFDVGTELYLNIPIRDGKDQINAMAEIIWHKQCRYVPQSQQQYHAYGLRFQEMSPEDAILASDFIYEVVRNNCEEEERHLIERFEELAH